MTALQIAGGVYRELVTWPSWNQVYGSGGRAAAALHGHVSDITLHTYLRPENELLFASTASAFGFKVRAQASTQSISFEYVHCLSTPIISPSLQRIRENPAIHLNDEVALRFGMLEGKAIVNAKYCVYDPQSPWAPEKFAANGSVAEHLAIVGNRSEIAALGGDSDDIASAQKLLAEAEVIVVKRGSDGAAVVTKEGISRVPAHRTDFVWTLGSGDVFAAMFSAYWSIHGRSPVEAAALASRGVASYASSMALPVPAPDDLARMALPATDRVKRKNVYLAGPFFNISQRWLVDEARRYLTEFGLEVFSPVHDVGSGPAEKVAPADIAAIDNCDLMLAILDGLDSGTLFEVGYARARNKPVIVFAQAVADEDLKMVTGSDCLIFSDFVTALYQTAWRS